MVGNDESIIVLEDSVSIFLINRGGVVTGKLINVDKVSGQVYNTLDHCKVLELLLELL